MKLFLCSHFSSVGTLENTKFVASELSLTLSLVLHFPIAFHEP